MDSKTQIEKLKEEIEAIKARNRKVESDKAWETSRTRKISIAIITYILVTIILISLGNESPFINAIIPAIAYLISTASVGIIKNWWMTKKKN